MVNHGAGQGPRRRRTLALVLGVFGGALVLGVALALILNVTGMLGGTVASTPTVSASSPTVAPPTSSSPPTPSSVPTPSSSPTPSAPVSPTKPPADFPSVFAKVKSGVVRVFASTCEGTGVGTGFLIDSRTVVTSLFSINQAVAAVVVTEAGPVVAKVSAVDAARGVAILSLEEKVDGHRFSVKKTDLKVGDAVGAVGMPSKTTAAVLARQNVSTVDVSAKAGKSTLKGMAKVSGSPDEAIGGGPVVDGSGAVIGMLVAHPDLQDQLIMPGSEIEKSITSPSRSKPAAGSCAEPKGAAAQTVVSGDASKKIKQTLMNYFEGLNSADYDQAYDQLGPDLQRGESLEKIRPGWISTYDFNIVIESASGSGSGSRASVTFDSIFAKGKGPKGSDTCARWSIDYGFVASGGKLLINSSKRHAGNSEFSKRC